MSHSSKISLKIGCDGTENEQNSQQIEVSFILNEAKLNEYNKNIQKDLGVKKTPNLAIQFNKNDGNKFPQNINLFDCDFEMKQKVVDEKRILYGDLKNQQTLLFIKKVERIMSNITQLQTSAKLKCSFYHAQLNKQSIKLEELLDRTKIQGTLKMDDKTPQIIKKCLFKVSPKFLQSPLFAFLELFITLDFKFDIESLSHLEESSRNKLLETFFNLKPHNQELSNLLKSNQKNPVRITFCFEKLMSLQILGPANLLALICQFL